MSYPYWKNSNMQMPKYMKSNYHIAYLSTFVRTTITLIDPHTTYFYNKGEISYCYFTLSPQILMLVIWTILLCMLILKDFPIIIPRLIFILFHCGVPLSGGIITWTNLNQNYSRVFQLMFQLFCLIILQKKFQILFFIYSYVIFHPYPIVAKTISLAINI